MTGDGFDISGLLLREQVLVCCNTLFVVCNQFHDSCLIVARRGLVEHFAPTFLDNERRTCNRKSVKHLVPWLYIPSGRVCQHDLWQAHRALLKQHGGQEQMSQLLWLYTIVTCGEIFLSYSCDCIEYPFVMRDGNGRIYIRTCHNPLFVFCRQLVDPRWMVARRRLTWKIDLVDGCTGYIKHRLQAALCDNCIHYYTQEWDELQRSWYRCLGSTRGALPSLRAEPGSGLLTSPRFVYTTGTNTMSYDILTVCTNITRLLNMSEVCDSTRRRYVESVPIYFLTWIQQSFCKLAYINPQKGDNNGGSFTRSLNECINSYVSRCLLIDRTLFLVSLCIVTKRMNVTEQFLFMLCAHCGSEICYYEWLNRYSHIFDLFCSLSIESECIRPWFPWNLGRVNAYDSRRLNSIYYDLRDVPDTSLTITSHFDMKQDIDSYAVTCFIGCLCKIVSGDKRMRPQVTELRTTIYLRLPSWFRYFEFKYSCTYCVQVSDTAASSGLHCLLVESVGYVMCWLYMDFIDVPPIPNSTCR